MTIFISGLGANLENDLKKIIALSTLRQLGLIIITLGLGILELAFFHLLTHAIFKSLLFLCAGVFIHSIGDTQDVRHLGGLMTGCPLTSFFFIISSMALCGFPFLSGFYSKDFILEIYFITEINIFYLLFIIIATFFTVTYSLRLIYLIFFGSLGIKTFNNIRENLGIVLPMGLLASLSIFMGAFISLELFPLVYIYLPLVIKTMVFIGITILFFLLFKNLKINIISTCIISKIENILLE